MSLRAFLVILVVGIIIGIGWPMRRTTSHLPSVASIPAYKPVPTPMPTPAKSWTVAARVEQYGEIVRRRVEPVFHRAGAPYPPAGLVFVILKQEKTLEVHAPGRDGNFRFVCAYPILAASGVAGPKFQEGDLQVPEGLYRIESLNPNSLFHLSLRINYPNEFDRANAQRENRDDLGGDIMIHGDALSVGCLAMGDPASEDLFVLAALAGPEHIRVIMSPLDMRAHGIPVPPPDAPPWLGPLYQHIGEELREHPSSPPAASATQTLLRVSR